VTIYIYINMKWFFVRFVCLFVCLFICLYLMQIGQHMTLPPPPHDVTFFRLPPALPETYFSCRMTTQTCQPTQSRACLRRKHASIHETVFWKILHVFRLLCPLACLHRHVVTNSGHFLLRYSHGTFFCNDLNALRRLHPLTCVYVSQPPRRYIFRSFRSSLLQHIPLTHLYSLQHPLLPMLSLSLL
jgi:hypothetical protein